MLLAFYLATFRNRLLLLAPAALALAALVKFIPVLLLLPLLVLIWRSGNEAKEQLSISQNAVKRVLIGGLGFVIVAVAIYAPFWVGTQTIGALWRQDLFTASIPTVVKDFLASHLNMPEAQAMSVVRQLAQVVTVLTVLLQSGLLLLRYKTGDEEHGLTLRLFSASYSIIFVYLIFATLWFQPWYQIWLIALTALPARRELLSRTVAVNIGGVANYFVWDFLVLWNNSWGQVVQWTSALVVNLPPLLYTAFQFWGKQAAAPAELEPVKIRPARQSAMTEGATTPPVIRRSATGHE
jgi:hypothetical protein